MNLQKRLEEIRDCHIHGLYNAGALLSFGVIEHSIRQFYYKGFAELPTDAKDFVYEAEKRIGKGERVNEFGLGTMVWFFKESQFLDRWTKASGSAFHPLTLVNLEKITTFRNKLTHSGFEAEAHHSRWLLGVVESILHGYDFVPAAVPAIYGGVGLQAAELPAPAAPLPRVVPSKAVVAPTREAAMNRGFQSRQTGTLPPETEPELELAERAEPMATGAARSVLEASDPQRALSEDGAAAAEVPSPVAALVSRLRLIEPGPFRPGSKIAGAEPVQFSRALYVDPYPVTQELYLAVRGKNPSSFDGPRLPVESVSWFDATLFCNELSRLLGLEEAYVHGKEAVLQPQASGFRLPSEAEWEYACTLGYDSSNDSDLERLAWFMNNARGSTNEVGLLRANEHGLHDMLGNVWEWCNDWYHPHPMLQDVDPFGPEPNFHKVCRGGSWSSFSTNLKSTYRLKRSPYSTADNVGFRVVTRTPLSTIQSRLGL